jgi:hypothetical protein
MDIGFHHGRVDAQLLAIFQAELDRGLDHGLIDGLQGGRGDPVEGAIAGVVLGTRWLSKSVKPRRVKPSLMRSRNSR